VNILLDHIEYYIYSLSMQCAFILKKYCTFER